MESRSVFQAETQAKHFSIESPPWHRDEEDEDEPRDLVAADVADCGRNRVTLRHFGIDREELVQCYCSKACK